MYVNSSDILRIFEMLNNNKVKYVLLRNINNELPNNFKANKDIDILVHPSSKEKLHNLLKNNGWKKIKHPLDNGLDFIFLYNMDKFEMFTKNNINLDICYQLSCRSLNRREWIPIDQKINDSVWINRKINNIYNWYEMSDEDQLIHLLTRCVFDKKKFEDGYVNEIDRLLGFTKIDNIKQKLELIFFKFTPYLLDLLKSHKYELIIKNYIQFKDY